MMAMASSGLTPGISASRSTAVSAAAPGPGPGDGTPPALIPPAAGIAPRGGIDLVLDRGDGPVEQGDGVQADPDQHAMVLAGERALQGVPGAFAPAPLTWDAARAARAPGSRWPPAAASTMSRAVLTLASRDTTDDSLTR